MKNSVLSEEISRIQEMMGVKLTLNENVPPQAVQKLVKFLSSFGDDFARMGRTFKGNPTEISSGFKLLKSAKNTTEVFDGLSKLMRASDELSDQIIPSVFNLIKNTPDGATAISEFDDFIKLALNSGKKPSDIVLKANQYVDMAFKSSPQGLKDILKQGYKSQIDDLSRTSKPSQPKVQNIPKNLGTNAEGFFKKYVLPGCRNHKDCQNFSKIASDFMRKLPNSQIKFYPDDVKIVDGPVMIDGRETMVVKMPNGENIIWNKSTGSNVATTGKEKGTWSVVPGFGSDVWFIKDEKLIELTRGGNKYLTDMADFLFANGPAGLGK